MVVFGDLMFFIISFKYGTRCVFRLFSEEVTLLKVVNFNVNSI